MSTYIHTYIHICLHTYIHTYIYVYIHTYIHTCIHKYIHTYVPCPHGKKVQLIECFIQLAIYLCKPIKQVYISDIIRLSYKLDIQVTN